MCNKLDEQLRIHSAVVPNFTLHNGILRYKNMIYVGESSELRGQLIDSFHNSTLGGHFGESVSYTRLKSLFHWPGMKSVVDSFI
jgi:hypothetical protein